jgi:hypothetical protein
MIPPDTSEVMCISCTWIECLAQAMRRKEDAAWPASSLSRVWPLFHAVLCLVQGLPPDATPVYAGQKRIAPTRAGLSGPGGTAGKLIYRKSVRLNR